MNDALIKRMSIGCVPKVGIHFWVRRPSGMKRHAIMTKVPARAVARVSSFPPGSVTRRSNHSAALVVYALLMALGLGLGSAYVALQGDPPFGSLQLGPWRTWPKLGSPEADPYMRAILARRGVIPLGIGEGLALSATEDSEGRRLEANCSYRIGSVTPGARLWTLSLYDREGKPPMSDLGRSGFTSAEILRNADDTFTVNLSRELKPGNWLQLPESGHFSVVLRFYDTPAAAGANLDADDVPAIERLGCGP